MKKPSNQIAAVRKRKGLTQQQLADLLGAHWITVSKIERGVMQTTTEWLERIAEALDVEIIELLGPQTTKREVFVEGHVSGGDYVAPYDESKIFEIEESSSTMSVIWVEVDDDSMAPFFGPRDLICFTFIVKEQGSFYVGKLALAWGPDETYTLGVLLPETKGSKVHLRTLKGRIVREIEVQALAIFSDCHVLWRRREIV